MALASRVVSALTYGIFSKAPVQYSRDTTGPGFGNPQGYASSSALELGNSVGTLFAIVDLFSTSVAGTEWHLYRKRTDGRRVYGPAAEERTEIMQHAALSVLSRPNPLMTRSELFERSEQYIDLIGESFWIIDRVGTIPVEIWPVRPDRMEEVIRGGQLAGWEYREPDGKRTSFGLDEVVHIKRPDPRDPIRGTSPVRAMTTDLEAVTLAGLYNRNFFLNSAQPGGIIQVPTTLGDTSFRRLQQQFREQHRGVSNAHRVGILENDAKWVDASVSNKDMEFVSLRNLSRELIREAYRVHPHKLGMSDSVNLANAYAADVTFAKDLLCPRLDRFKDALNSVFLPMFGETGKNVEFCYEDPIPEFQDEVNADRDSKVRAAVALIREGADPAETLEAFGLPEIAFTAKPVALPAVADPTAPPTPEQLMTMLNKVGVR